jgi:hypothetical protein
MRSLALLGWAALACAHSTGAQSGGAAPSGPVALQFAWPDAFESHVLIAHESRRTGSEPTGLIARQRMVTERKQGEIWVYTRDLAARGNEPDLESTVKINEALIQVVAPDGKFRRAEGLEQALAAMKAATPEEKENARQALIRSTAFDWELMVGAWTGEKLAPDEVHRKQVKAYVPLLAQVEAALDVEYALEGRVPCTDEDTARRCVQLSYRARIAPGDRQAVVERILKLSAAKPDQPVPEDVHADLELLLVTDPETLVPHRMSEREHLRLRLRLPDGHVRETEDRSEDTYLFGERERPVKEPEAPHRDL